MMSQPMRLNLALIVSCLSIVVSQTTACRADANCDQIYEAAKSAVLKHKQTYLRTPAEAEAGLDSTAADLISALAQCPDSEDILVLISHIRFQQGRLDESREFAMSALEIAPDSAAAHELVALSSFPMGESELGLSHFERAFALAPNDSKLRMNYCSSLENTGRYQQAVSICTPLVDNPQFRPVAHYIRGRAYEALGNADQANADYEAAANLGYSPDAHYPGKQTRQ